MLSNEQKQILTLEKQINDIAKRKSRYEYLGILSEYQTQPELIAQRLDNFWVVTLSSYRIR